jgi:hypothetical protein
LIPLHTHRFDIEDEDKNDNNEDNDVHFWNEDEGK